MSADASNPSPTPDNADHLPDDPLILKGMIRELLQALQNTQQDNEQLRHRLDQLLRRVYGQRAERFDPDQPWLFPELQTASGQPSSPAPSSTENEPAPKKNGHGRRCLPDNLPRRRVEHKLTEAQCACPECGALRTKISEEVSEQLDYHPASLFVIEHVRFKYACPKCQGCVTIAPKPEQPIAKGLPGPGLLAQVTVSKYADHLPLHRLERIFSRHGLELSRSTMCDWVAAVAQILKPLHQLLAQRVLASRVVQTDDTPIPVQDPEAKRTSTGRMWVYKGDRDHPYTVFDYTPSRSRDGPEKFLGAFAGYLQADAYAGYDHLFAQGRIVEVGCWAHARRQFYEAQQSDPQRASLAMAQIRRLYQIEKEAKERTDAERLALRQERAVPILTELCHWLTDQHEPLPKSPIRQAIGYALNQWPALVRYTEQGFLNIDNNPAERALRTVVLGRKNWLFAGSDRGGKTAAILFTFTVTCRDLGIDPFAYLRDVLSRLAQDPAAAALDSLLPDAWQPTQPPSSSA